MHAHEQGGRRSSRGTAARISIGVSGLCVSPTVQTEIGHRREQRPRVAELDVHRAPVGACAGEVLEEVAGVVDLRDGNRGGDRCALRSDLHDTGGPIERLGTKCPSITSTWRRSASAATRSTSSASWAKSADRIDGAILAPVMASHYVRRSPRTYIPSESASCGEQDRAPPAVATAHRAEDRRRVAGARAPPTSTPVVSSPVSVHTEYKTTPLALTVGRAAQQVALEVHRAAGDHPAECASAAQRGGAGRPGRCTARRPEPDQRERRRGSDRPSATTGRTRPSPSRSAPK